METPLPPNENPHIDPNEEHAGEPQPNGPPQPIELDRGSKGSVLFKSAMVVTAASGLAILLVGNRPTRCAGSTRSSQLEWQTRQQEIDTAIRAAQPLPSPTNEQE